MCPGKRNYIIIRRVSSLLSKPGQLHLGSTLEAIVSPGSLAEGSTASGLHLHASFGVNLLGLSRLGDYRRMGLPLVVATVSVSIPLIMLAWPLGV